MKPREQKLVIGGTIFGLLIGLLVGVFIDSIYPGTAVDNDNEESAAQDNKNLAYYLVDLDTAQTWLSEWADKAYADSADKPDVAAYIQAISLIADETQDFRKVTTDAGDQMQEVLIWTQAALAGIETADNPDTLSEKLPKDSAIIACLALDADPWTIDPNYISGVKLYLVVPEAENKNVPKDWTSTQPKNEFDIGWTPLRCNPDDNK